MFLNFAFADIDPKMQVAENNNTQVESSENEKNTPIDVSTPAINTDKIDDGIKNIANTGENLAYTIVEQISDKSLPVCAILILWGAVLYFILGIRNLYKKRQGLLLMWGAFTFVVIAKIMNFAFWFAFIR